MPPLLRLLRPHQWAKNALAFVGLLAAHRWGDVDAWQATLHMFIALSLVASAIYVFNDALDVDSDRLDPDKRERPLASGSVSLRLGLAMIPLLLALALAVAWQLPRPAQWALATYAAGALIYNLGVKRTLWLDVVLLAALYAMRVIAGALAAAVEPSPWLVSFSLFVFISLAALKRYAELVRSPYEQLPGRAYRREDRSMVAAFGVAAALAATVVLALYVNGSDVIHMYRTPQVLWALGAPRRAARRPGAVCTARSRQLAGSAGAGGLYRAGHLSRVESVTRGLCGTPVAVADRTGLPVRTAGLRGCTRASGRIRQPVRHAANYRLPWAGSGSRSDTGRGDAGGAGRTLSGRRAARCQLPDRHRSGVGRARARFRCRR